MLNNTTDTDAAALELRRPPLKFQLAGESVTSTIDLTTIFPPGTPVEIDLGAGNGRFLLARASANPNIGYIAIERLLDRVRKINRKLEFNNLNNVRVIRLEALYTLEYLIPLHSITTVYIHFPDPWPKRRHHRRRLFSPEFLTTLHRRLVPGGTVQIATDHPDYYDVIRKVFRADPNYAETTPIPRLPHEQTDFEVIFRSKDMPINQCAYTALALSDHLS